MRLALVLTALAGCYNPTINAGSACDDVCPGDLMCLNHRCVPPGTLPDPDAPPIMIDAAIDARPIDGPPGDQDADGHNDLVDNCPTKPNADQHDEDGDMIGDVCDPCPHIAGTAADADGDGVGDACDPQPQVAKQHIKFFDPFTSTRPEWNNLDNTTRAGDTMEMIGNVTNGAANAHLAVTTGELRVEAGGTVVGIAPNNPPHQMSIAFRGGLSAYYYTEFYDTGGTTADIAISKYDGSSFSSPALGHYPGTLPTGAWNMRIDESVVGQQIALATTVGGVAQPMLTAPTMAPALQATTEMSIYVDHVDIKFNYFIVIETTP